MRFLLLLPLALTVSTAHANDSMSDLKKLLAIQQGQLAESQKAIRTLQTELSDLRTSLNGQVIERSVKTVLSSTDWVGLFSCSGNQAQSSGLVTIQGVRQTPSVQIILSRFLLSGAYQEPTLLSEEGSDSIKKQLQLRWTEPEPGKKRLEVRSLDSNIYYTVEVQLFNHNYRTEAYRWQGVRWL